MEYKTIKSEGKRLDYLNHTITLMKTEKDVKINKVFELIAKYSFVRIVCDNLRAVPAVIAIVRSFENELIYIRYYITSGAVLSIEFKHEEIEEIVEEDSVLAIKLKNGLGFDFT